MHRQEEYIAVFDSGVGGISVLRELVKLMPEENYLYFGDSANAPYGKRTTDQVRQLTLESPRFYCGMEITSFWRRARFFALAFLARAYRTLL